MNLLCFVPLGFWYAKTVDAQEGRNFMDDDGSIVQEPRTRNKRIQNNELTGLSTEPSWLTSTPRWCCQGKATSPVPHFEKSAAEWGVRLCRREPTPAESLVAVVTL